MQTRALNSLVTIARMGAFARAADELGLTLSTLSMQIKSLEAELAVTLFDRSVRPPRLTPIGHAVVAEAERMLAREARIADLCRPTGALVGRFKLGFVSTAAVRLLPDFLRNAETMAPNATFELETGLSSNLQDRVVRGQLDAAVVTDAQGLPKRLIPVRLQREPFVFAAHRDLLSEGIEALLRDGRFFHFMPQTGIGTLIADAMTTFGRPSEAETIVLDNLEAIMGCVAAGLGFTLLPVPDVQRYATPEIETAPAPEGLERKLVLVLLRDGPLARRDDALAKLFSSRQ